MVGERSEICREYCHSQDSELRWDIVYQEN